MQAIDVRADSTVNDCSTGNDDTTGSTGNYAGGSVTVLDASIAIARMLGESEDWSPGSEYLESIAELIHATGAPHPGDADTFTYYDELMIALDDER